MQVQDWRDGLGAKVDHRILFTWAALLSVLLILKASLAPHCIPRYPDVMTGNLLLAAAFIAGAFGIHLSTHRTAITIEGFVISAFTLYSFYEALTLLPFVYQEPAAEGGISAISLFFLVLIINFSVILSYLSLERHIVPALAFLGVEAFYIHLLMEKLQNESEMLLPFLLLHTAFLFILFRSLKIINMQQKRTNTLLSRQRELNEKLAASDKRLMEQEKLVAIAKMSAGLSHQINNPLTYLQGNLLLLEEKLESIENPSGDASKTPADKGESTMESRRGEIQSILEDYRRGFAQIGAVVDRLGYLGRQSTHTHEWCNVREIVKTCVEVQNTIAGSRVTIQFEQGEPVWIYGSPSDFVSLCTNILENAVEAFETSGEPGKITVELESGDKYVLLSFSDNGPGIAPEIVDRVSGPFFTTGESGVKLGLGLAMCRHILIDYGGELNIESTEGEGTRVTAKFARRSPDG